MALKKFNPVTPSTRQLVIVDRSGLYKGKPVKGLTEGLTKSGGRNNYGRVTARFIGGGHKRSYRIIDFKRRKLDVVGTVQDGVGHGFANPHLGDARNHIVQAFDMLHIQGGIDIDACRQQFLDIQIALGMAAAGRIVVRQLIHQHQAGPALQNGVQVHLRQHAALVGKAPLGDRLDAFGEKIGLDPTVGFDHADHGVDAIQPAAADLHQHLIGLADARGGPQEYLEPATPLLSHRLEQGIR